jgi:hypothetical protein
MVLLPPYGLFLIFNIFFVFLQFFGSLFQIENMLFFALNQSRVLTEHPLCRARDITGSPIAVS